MIKLLVFDLDGTLVDSKIDLWRAVNFALECKGFPVTTLPEVVSSIGNGARHLVERSLMLSLKSSNKLEDSLIDEVQQIFLQSYFTHCTENTILYPGVRKFLMQNRPWQKALLTNKSDAPSRKILAHLEILNAFIYIVGGDSPLGKKPDPAGLNHLLKNARAKPEEAVLIGDGVQDFKVAEAAGVAFIGFLGGLGSREALLAEKPKHTLEDFSDLNHILSRL